MGKEKLYVTVVNLCNDVWKWIPASGDKTAAGKQTQRTRARKVSPQSSVAESGRKAGSSRCVCLCKGKGAILIKLCCLTSPPTVRRKHYNLWSPLCGEIMTASAMQHQYVPWVVFFFFFGREDVGCFGCDMQKHEKKNKRIKHINGETNSCFPVCRWSRPAERWWTSLTGSTTGSCTYRRQVFVQQKLICRVCYYVSTMRRDKAVQVF